MQPFTRALMEFQRDSYAMSKRKEYIKDAVETIYYATIEASVKRSSHSFYYTVRSVTYIADAISLSEAIRDELQVLFPDFTISIGDVDDGYNSSRYICVKW
jgi:hypothetical protein